MNTVLEICITALVSINITVKMMPEVYIIINYLTTQEGVRITHYWVNKI